MINNHNEINKVIQYHTCTVGVPLVSVVTFRLVKKPFSGLTFVLSDKAWVTVLSWDWMWFNLCDWAKDFNLNLAPILSLSSNTWAVISSRLLIKRSWVWIQPGAWLFLSPLSHSTSQLFVVWLDKLRSLGWALNSSKSTNLTT